MSCSAEKMRYEVYTIHGTGWDKVSSRIRCDSVKMITPTHARVYIDGTVTDLYADEILIGN